MVRRSAAALLVAASLIAFPGGVFAQRDAKPAKDGEESVERPFDYRMTTLDNGLKVITLEDFSTPTVAFQLWYKVGSKNEEEDRHGFAHMFEHMMFQGTELLDNKDHMGFIRRAGGSTNAYTAFDNTTYLQDVPPDQLEMVMWLEAERLGFLKIDDRAFATERKVVEEELRSGREQPYGEVAEKVLAELFKVAPYGWTPGGSIEHLRKSTSADLQRFWEKYYIPNNAVLVVAGAAKHDEVAALAQKYFSWIPAGEKPEQPMQQEPEQTAAREITIRERKGPIPALAITVHGPGNNHEDSIPLQMMSMILGGGESSRLNRRLVRKEKAAVAAFAGSFGFMSSGVIGAAALMNPLGTADLAAIRKSLDEEIEKMRTELVTPAELEKARNNMLRGEVTQLLSVSSKASALGNAEVLEGNVENVNTQIARIKAVTAEDIKRVAEKYLQPQRKSYITIQPDLLGGMMDRLAKGSGGLDKEDAPVLESPKGATFGNGKPGLKRPDWWGKKPPIKPINPSIPEFATVEEKLENGLRVVVVPNHEVPFVSMTLGVLTGAMTEPADRPGTASMAAAMVTKGTKNFDAEALAEELDSKAISLGASIGMDSGSISASALTDQAPRAMELMAEVVQNPTFPKDEFEKLLDQAKTGKQVSEKSPKFLADRELRRRLWAGTPYEREADGELKDLDKVELEKSKEWWQANIRPDTAVLYVAGDIQPEEAVALARKSFGGWKAEGEAPKMEMPAPPPHEGMKIYLVDQPGATQSEIRMGHVSMTRHDEDFAEGRLMTSIFGGDGLDTRLNRSIRVEKGLTYGAYGGFFPQRFGGQFFISTFSKTDTTAKAVEAILEEVDEIKTVTPTADEMETNQNYIVGSFAGGRETPQDIVQDQWMLTREGLPKDYFKTYLTEVASLKPEAVTSVAQRRIDKKNLAIVVAGDARKVKESLEKIAPVEVVKPEGGKGGKK